MKRSKHTHARTHKEIDFTLQLVLLILAVSFNPNLVRGGGVILPHPVGFLVVSFNPNLVTGGRGGVILPHPVGFPLITQKQ